MLVSPSGRITFAEVDERSRNIAVQWGAAARGGEVIGLAAPNGAPFIAGFLALRRANATILLLDPAAPSDDRRRAAEVMEASAILEWRSGSLRFAELRRGTRMQSTDRVAVVKLTSGSTGTPRGVAMTAAQLMADEAQLATTMGFRDDDRIATAVPMSHSYGFTTVALSAIVRGLTLILPADDGPFGSLRAARELGATIFPTVPSYLGALLKMAEPPQWPSSVRLVISAGAALSPSIAKQFRTTYGLPVHVLYGSSECGGICYDREGTSAERGTVGTPVDGVRLTLEGDGVVAVEAASVGDGYFPIADRRLGHGRFETSDLAEWRDGELVLLRRIDDVINVRGHKVDPAEVEQVLSGLDGVEEVVVLGVASQDQREQIVRAVVACSTRRLEYQEIASWCRARLADHKVPRSVVIVDAIPRTARGKVDRSALRSDAILSGKESEG